MKKAMLPLNLELLVPTQDELRRIRPVTTLDIFDGPGGNFHEDGLFSTLTFGRVGDPERNVREGYIPLRLPILLPSVHNQLVRLKGLYRDILSGRGYGKWNPTAKDFEVSDELNGETGYAFFMAHIDVLQPPRTGSTVRDTRVSMFENARRDGKLTTSHLIVIPAGLRDAEIGTDGRVEMDEVNEEYQSVLMQVRNLPETVRPTEDISPYDRVRYTLTLKFQAIYDYLEGMLSGKHGFIQEYWASRRVFNGTRNVFSSLDTSVLDFSKPNRPKFNNVTVGIYQAARSVLPKSIYALKTSPVGDIFNTSSNTVELINPDTYQREWVEISSDELDRWQTEEGLERVINELSVQAKRHRPVMVGEYYLALIYVDDAQNYRIFRNIDELPEWADTKHVRPITYVELVYLSGATMWNKQSAFVTRYPVENANSSAPHKLYTKTTIVGEMRYELDDNWERKGDDYVALEFPRLNGDKTQYFDAMSVNPSKLESYGADFDGDTGSLLATYSIESNAEVDNYFRKRQAYIRAGGGLAFSVNIHSLALCLRSMTGP